MLLESLRTCYSSSFPIDMLEKLYINVHNECDARILQNTLLSVLTLFYLMSPVYNLFYFDPGTSRVSRYDTGHTSIFFKSYLYATMLALIAG